MSLLFPGSPQADRGLTMGMRLLEWQVARVLAPALSLGEGLRWCQPQAFVGSPVYLVSTFFPASASKPSCFRRNQHLLSLPLGS